MNLSKLFILSIGLLLLFVIIIIAILYREGYSFNGHTTDQNQWDFLDKVVYINLESRPDRRAQIENELYSRIPPEKIIRLDAVYDQHGHLGCSQSHIKALEMAIQGQWKNVLIVEDDAMWNSYDNGYKRLVELIKENPTFDVITLGNVGASFDSLTGRLYRAQTCTAYLVNNHYFHILHDNFVRGYNELSKIREMTSPDQRFMHEQQYCVDQYWKVLQPRDNWFIVNPALMIQRPSKSSIVGGVDVDYTSYFNL